MEAGVGVLLVQFVTKTMTLGRLKWVAIIGPIAALTVLWTLVHTVFMDVHRFPEVFILLGLTAVGIGLFAWAVFAVVTRLERTIIEQNEELGALLAVGRAASSSLELGALLDEGMDAILEATRTDAAEVWLAAGDDELRLARHRGVASEAFTEIARYRVGVGLPGLAAERGAPVVVHDLPSDARFLRERVKALGFHTYCALPLRHRGTIVGVLGVASRDPDKLCTERELRLLEGIGERLAAAIENSRLHERVLDEAVLEERMRIARELHDGLAQVLGYINTQTLAVRKLLASGQADAAQTALAAMEAAARDVYGDIREAILGLRLSFGRQGLVPALRRYLADYEPIAGAALRLEANGDVEAVELPPSVEIQLVRIVQEALANVRKHANAAVAVVRVDAAGESLTLEIEDDGRGFAAEPGAPTGWPRLGLQTMRERAQALGGEFELTSEPGRGTRVWVRVPLAQPAQVAYAGSAR